MKKLKKFLIGHFEGALIALILIGILSIAFLVQYKLAFLNFFFLPVILAGYYLGKNRGVLTAIFAVLVVVFYLFVSRAITGQPIALSLDDVIRLISWGSFLILTGALIGAVSQEREGRMVNLRRAYIGVLEIMFKYLESADDRQPASLRIAALAGRIAAAAGMETRDSENIKSAALLSATGNFHDNLPVFKEMTQFLDLEVHSPDSSFGDREKVMLKATTSLLEEVEPLLGNFYEHFLKRAKVLDKDLANIPIGSCIIALAHIYDKIASGVPPFMGIQEFGSVVSLRKLSGRTFHTSAIAAMILVVSSP